MQQRLSSINSVCKARSQEVKTLLKFESSVSNTFTPTATLAPSAQRAKSSHSHLPSNRIALQDRRLTHWRRCQPRRHWATNETFQIAKSTSQLVQFSQHFRIITGLRRGITMSFNKFPMRIVEENGPTPFLEKRYTDVSENYSTTFVQHLWFAISLSVRFQKLVFPFPVELFVLHPDVILLLLLNH